MRFCRQVNRHLKLDISAGHPFCRECLSRWQATSHLCPVCRTDQRSLEQNASQGAGQSSRNTHGPDHAEGPSLAAILGLMGQLLAREGPFEVQPPLATHRSEGAAEGIHISWGSQPTGTSASQPAASTAAVAELQSSVHLLECSNHRATGSLATA